MEEITILGRDDEHALVKRLAAHYDAPAFARRALQVQEAFDQLIEQCRQQRDKWLSMVRLRLGVLHALAGDLDKLQPLLANEDQLTKLRHLHQTLQPRLRASVESTSSLRILRGTLDELRESIDRFNRRWQKYLRSVDLTRVNELRDGYNRYYLLEKECALRSPRLARQGFTRLPAVALDDLEALVPLLPALELRD